MRIGDRAKPRIPPVEPGVYMAVCVHSIELGEQLSEKSKGYAPKVLLGFELIGEIIEIDGKAEPRTLSRTFTVATGQNSGLRKFVESWLGKKYSTEDEFKNVNTNDLVGVPAQLSVVLNDTGEYANIDGIMQLPKGMPAPQATAPQICFDIDPWSDEAFQSLPEWAQERIKKSSQYQKEHTPTDKVDFKEEPAQAVLEAAASGGGCPI